MLCSIINLYMVILPFAPEKPPISLPSRVVYPSEYRLINRYRFLNISAAFEAKILKIEEATANCSTYCNCCVRIILSRCFTCQNIRQSINVIAANGLNAKQTAFMLQVQSKFFFDILRIVG